MRLIAGAVAWLMLAGAVPAANLSASFAVSVQVVGSCSPEQTDTLLHAGALRMPCSRGTGYEILVDGHTAGAGAGAGSVQIQPLLAASATSPDGTPAAGPHWLTILY